MSSHPDFLWHHFKTPTQQFESTKLGMWLFLATEILLFGGLFCAYAVYRGNHPEMFIYAHHYLDWKLGATNTVILLVSSLTMAWAVRASQLGQKNLLVLLLGLTLLGGFGFMGIKYVEYQAKFAKGLVWAGKYDYHPEHPADHADDHAAGQAGEHAAAPPAAAAPAAADADGFQPERTLMADAALPPAGLATATHAEDDHGEPPANLQVFFSIYFLMTGLHGAHVLIGMGLIAWVMIRAMGGHFSPAYFTPVDMVGLYWHLVDLIWIFLFPLLYLIG